MAQVRVSIVDPSGGKKTQVEVPDSVPAEKLTRALVNRMGLPAVNQNGQPISYRLGTVRDGEDSAIDPDQTFAEAGIRADDTLRLYADMQAGRSEGGCDA